MKIYQVRYISFEDAYTSTFFCNKVEAEKWIKENKDKYENVDYEPTLLHLKSTKKRDIVDFFNHNTLVL